MKLLTKKLRTKLPPLYSAEHTKDPIAVVKLFHPLSAWTFYATYAVLNISCIMPSTGLCRDSHLSPYRIRPVNSA